MNWLNGSRKRLLTIWLPLNLLSITLATYTYTLYQKVDLANVREYSEGLQQASTSL